MDYLIIAGRAKMPVPSLANGGLRSLLNKLYYEQNIVNPDYAVERDWDSLRENNHALASNDNRVRSSAPSQ